MVKRKKADNPDLKKEKKAEETVKDKKKGKKAGKKKTEGMTIKASTEVDPENLFHAKRKSIRELVAPNGVNPNPLDYMVIDDGGIPLYTMCFYIHKLPRNATFASTFASIFNFPNVTTNVFIDPLVAGKSTKMLDKRVMVLDSERLAAEKAGDRNKYRKIEAKLQDAEAWASAIESGNNLLFEVAFLFTLQAQSLESLRLKCSDFHMRAREKGIEVMACYGVHPEAFLSGYPTNKLYNSFIGPIKTSCVKKHILDKGALSTIFNHTRSSFSHKNGIIAGRNLHTGQPITFDIFDSSHDGYNLVCAGKTGTGKSATIKMYLSRYMDFGVKVRSIDFDSRGIRGEYSMMASCVGGVNFQIKNDSTNILNIFEINEEDEFDETTGTEYTTLNLADKINDARNLLMVMIRNGKDIPDFSDMTFIEGIVSDTVSQLYSERGIKDKEVASLYEFGNGIINGRLQSGKVKKTLPTITDFYKLVLQRRFANTEPNYDRPLLTILDAMKKYVKELYFCPACMKFYSREEYEALPMKEGSHYCNCCNGETQVTELHGTCAYFDGQTTVHADSDTTHVNIDISQLPKADRIVGLLVAMNYFQEHDIKKNSSNPRLAKQMILLIDELHRTFPYPEARLLVSDQYRTARKRNVSVWSATQALADYAGYEETESIVKNATATLLLKQAFQDREFLRKSTPLTDSQLEEIFTLGGDLSDPEESKKRKGELCLIDNNNVTFVKVDYLTDSEAVFVETDMNKIQELYKGRAKVGA